MECNQHTKEMGCHPEEPRQAQVVSTGEPHEVEQIQMEGIAPGLWKPHCQVQLGR